jgi:methylmalonyl-CoA mutase
MIVAGGVIPRQDYPALYEAGASAIFGPGTVVSDAAGQLLRVLAETLGLDLNTRTATPPAAVTAAGHGP